MITGINNTSTKKYRAYVDTRKKQQELLDTSCPVNLIFFGNHQEQVCHNGKKIFVNYEDAFLVDKAINPRQAIRLTGKNPNYQSIPIEVFKSNNTGGCEYIYVDDNGSIYEIQEPAVNHPAFQGKYDVTVAELIQKTNLTNMKTLQLAQELAEREISEQNTLSK